MPRWTAVSLLLTALALHLLAFPAAAQPRIRQSDPKDGALLTRLPNQGRVCLSEPIELGFTLTLTAPDGRNVLLATSFPPDGECIGISIEKLQGSSDGEWTLRWQATSRETQESGSGAIRFAVKSAAAPASGDGNAAAADDGPDIGTLALVTTAAVLGAAGLGLVLYLFRMRIGFWLHRPPPRSGGQGHH